MSRVKSEGRCEEGAKEITEKGEIRAKPSPSYTVLISARIEMPRTRFALKSLIVFPRYKRVLPSIPPYVQIDPLTKPTITDGIGYDGCIAPGDTILITGTLLNSPFLYFHYGDYWAQDCPLSLAHRRKSCK